MCKSIDILDGRELNTVQELVDYLGGEENIKWNKGQTIPKNMETCLCPVNIELTFKKIGKRIVPTPFGFEEKI